jgi:hypothetical protein
MEATSRTDPAGAASVSTPLIVGVVGLSTGALALMVAIAFGAVTDGRVNRLSFLCYGVPGVLVGLAVGALFGMVVAAPLQRLRATKAKLVLASVAAMPVALCCLGGGIAVAVGARAQAADADARDRLLHSLWVSDIGHALVFYSDGTYGGGLGDREGRRFVLFPDTHSWRIERGELCMVGDDLIWQCDRTTVEEDRIGLTECRGAGDCVTMWFTATDVDGWECSGEWCGSFTAQRLR